MKNTAIENKLETLKGIIRKMNSNTVELINFSASAEINIRKTKSNYEIQNIENEIDKFINQYKLHEKAKENGELSDPAVK